MLPEPIPEGSIYLWMYRQGLKEVPISEILAECAEANKIVREKDTANYWRGVNNSRLYRRQGKDLLDLPQPDGGGFLGTGYSDYPPHPYSGMPEIDNRWVPCTKEGRPLIKWGKGCLPYGDAVCYPKCESLGENLKGTHLVVVDCDGDHDGIDPEVIEALAPLMGKTHAMRKPKSVGEYECYTDSLREIAALPASFHLTFSVDRVIPTMHFPEAHMDIIGNRANSIRYRKNKIWNGREMIPMTEEIWSYLQRYVQRRRDEHHDVQGNR